MTAPRLTQAAARAIIAIELRNAASLRRDVMKGHLPRRPAISAICDCLRHARAVRFEASQKVLA